MVEQQNTDQLIADLAHRVTVLEAAQAVRTLQHQYGYYLDKCLYQEVVDLFADDGDVYFCGGLYQGKEGVRRLYLGRFRERFTHGFNGPLFGFLLDHPQHQDVITVSEDGQSAQARFRSVMQAGVHEQAKDTFTGAAAMQQWFEGGIYENEYVNDHGTWKIKRLNYRAFWHGDYDKGWAKTPPMDFQLGGTYPDSPYGPDQILDEGFEFYPNTEVFPFHYRHPVTGQVVESEDNEAAKHG
ncbi:nuclear transport factor 2 family protein [Citricoccus sp. GCM10030269]|uniref:nuclear transport factor 2 family protein n=1 Tax=Citricoccus sp. GCM10030269 TaxID=3273388 RepID=UPI003607B8BA